MTTDPTPHPNHCAQRCDNTEHLRSYTVHTTADQKFTYQAHTPEHALAQHIRRFTIDRTPQDTDPPPHPDRITLTHTTPGE